MKLKHFLCIFAFTNYARTSGRLRLLGRVLRHAVALLVIGFLAITAFRRISLLDILERSFANSAISAHWSTLPSVNATNITVIADKKENVDAFEKAFAEFAVFQNEALRTRNFTDKNVIIAKVDNGVGIGNRMPLVAACFLWAMLTRRVFLTNYAHFYEYFEPAKELVNFNMDPYMTDLKAAIPNDDYTWHCDHGLFESLLDANLTISWRLLRIVRIECWDNPQFPLFGNPHYTAILKNWFPKSDPFHRIGTKLFRLNPKWTAMTESFHSNRLSSFSKVIGVHLRTKKLVPRRLALNVDHFVNLVAAHIEAFPRTMTNGSRINADPYLGHKPQRLRRQKRLKTVIYVAGDDEGTRECEFYLSNIDLVYLTVVYRLYKENRGPWSPRSISARLVLGFQDIWWKSWHRRLWNL